MRVRPQLRKLLLPETIPLPNFLSEQWLSPNGPKHTPHSALQTDIGGTDPSALGSSTHHLQWSTSTQWVQRGMHRMVALGPFCSRLCLEKVGQGFQEGLAWFSWDLLQPALYTLGFEAHRALLKVWPFIGFWCPDVTQALFNRVWGNQGWAERSTEEPGSPRVTWAPGSRDQGACDPRLCRAQEGTGLWWSKPCTHLSWAPTATTVGSHLLPQNWATRQRELLRRWFGTRFTSGPPTIPRLGQYTGRRGQAARGFPDAAAATPHPVGRRLGLPGSVAALQGRRENHLPTAVEPGHLQHRPVGPARPAPCGAPRCPALLPAEPPVTPARPRP